jgi:ABC-type lipoprotein release transport system permease subunit
MVALGVTRVISNLLFGVSATDPQIFIGVPLLLIAVAMLATYFPAHRALRVDPVVALRES